MIEENAGIRICKEKLIGRILHEEGFVSLAPCFERGNSFNALIDQLTLEFSRASEIVDGIDVLFFVFRSKTSDLRKPPPHA